MYGYTSDCVSGIAWGWQYLTSRVVSTRRHDGHCRGDHVPHESFAAFFGPAPSNQPAPIVDRVRSCMHGRPGKCTSAMSSHEVVLQHPTETAADGSAISPIEVFLTGIAASGVLLVERRAKQLQVPLIDAEAVITGIRQPTDPTAFTCVVVRITLTGPNLAEATRLVKYYQQRCPLFRTLAGATRVEVQVAVQNHAVWPIARIRARSRLA